jgi:hypothetical protein
MAALDLLREARQVLADESNWCQRHAVHPSGRGKSVLGAVGYRFHAADHPDTMAAVQLLARESSIYESVFVQDFNDTHSHAEVLALLDKAMALVESDAAKGPVAQPEPPDAEREPSWRNQVPC